MRKKLTNIRKTMENTLNKKIAEQEAFIRQAQAELARLKEQKEKTKDIKGIEKWIGNEFESSSGKTPEFAQFSRDFKKHLKGVAGAEYELIYSAGHFYVSGFFKNKATGKYAYFSTSDVRYFKDAWYNDVLVRTVEHDKDYTGGSNHSFKLDQLGEAIDQLTQ